MDGEITNVWISQDRQRLAFEIGDGDALFVAHAGYQDLLSVSELEGDWIPLGGGR